MSDMSNLKLPDVTALVAFGKLGCAVLASRMLSLLALVGVLALAAYVAYSPSNVGLAAVAIVAIFAFMPALKAESGQRQEPADKE